MSGCLIEASGIEFEYASRFGHFEIAFDHLSILKKQVFYLFGASGCGKTTVLNLLVRLVEPKSGAVRLASELKEGRLISYVMQRSTLLPWLDIRDNITREASFRGIKICDSDIASAVHVTDLADHVHKLPVQLSGGMRSRAEIARALCMRPKLLMLDEAFQGIDSVRRAKIFTELFSRVERDEMGVVACSHQPLEIMMAADRVVLFSGEDPPTLEEVAIVTPRAARDNTWYDGNEGRELKKRLGWAALRDSI